MADVWSEARRDFPALERHVYLNAAAGSPTPRPVREAIDAFCRDIEQGGDLAWNAWIERREAVREQVARFVGAEADEIAFTPNTSAGINIAADLVAQDGDVLSDELEFPTVTLPFVHRGTKVHFLQCPTGRPLPEDFGADVAPRAATLAVSHVQFSNGCRLDLAALGRVKAGRHLVVSGSQSVGVLPVECRAWGLDVLASAGHKWLCAGYGASFVFVSRALLERRPAAMGWLSVERPFRFDNQAYTLLRSARRYELGCPAFPGIFALGAAVAYLAGLGREAIEARVLALNTELTERLDRAGLTVLSPLGRFRSGETLVAVPDPVRAQEFLAQQGVHVTRKVEGLRISTHFYNDTSDLETCVAALRAYVRTRG